MLSRSQGSMSPVSTACAARWPTAEHAWSENRRMLCMWSMTLAGPTA